jgi:predicted nucleic acid-binding protein
MRATGRAGSVPRPATARASEPKAYVAEPPAQYLARPPIVIDCSVLGAFLFAESTAEVARQLIAGRELHAPWLLDHEIANVASKKHRGGAPGEAVEAAIARYLEFDVNLHRTAPDVVLPLAEAYALSAYDAAYLALASELRVPLITFDSRLGKAAMRHLPSLS